MLELETKRIQLNLNGITEGLVIKYFCTVIDGQVENNITANIFIDDHNSIGNVYSKDGEEMKVNATVTNMTNANEILAGIQAGFKEILENLSSY